MSECKRYPGDLTDERWALIEPVLTAGGGTASRLVNGDTVEYAAGHRPLVPDITATSLTGAPIKMSDYRGKVLVLNFWGSWCAPCRAEAPTLEVAYEQYHPRGVDFLGDDLDDTVTNALSFMRFPRTGWNAAPRRFDCSLWFKRRLSAPAATAWPGRRC